MELKWCRKCQWLGIEWESYSRWFAKCTYDYPHMADEQLHYERRIASFYHDKSFPGHPLEHLLKYDDKSNYAEKEKWLKPDLNIVPEPQFKIPNGCPYMLEYVMMLENRSDTKGIQKC